MDIEEIKKRLEKKAFKFEDSDGTLKNKTVWLIDVFEMLDALSLLPVVVRRSEQLPDDKLHSPCDGCTDACKNWEIFFCKIK